MANDYSHRIGYTVVPKTSPNDLDPCTYKGTVVLDWDHMFVKHLFKCDHEHDTRDGAMKCEDVIKEFEKLKKTG